jgi:hypothetical protein
VREHKLCSYKTDSINEALPVFPAGLMPSEANKLKRIVADLWD